MTIESIASTPRVATQQLLEVKNISVDYYAANGTVHALNDVSISLRRGEILGLAGESGSGKSTLAYAIARLLRPPAAITAGQVLYHPRATTDDEAIQRATDVVDILRMTPTQLRAFRWRELAIVFQSAMNALNPVMNIGTQIADVLHAHRPFMKASAIHERSLELLRLVGIAPDRIHSYPHELSGGMRQRAMIAISLALSPELIIMDEPTTALDVVVQREILTEITSLSKRLNFSVIFITHDLSLLLEIADKIAIMYAGRIVETANAQELHRQPLHPYSYGLLNSFPTLHGPRHKMTGIPGSPPDLRMIPTGCAFHPRCPAAFHACSTTYPPLQAVNPETHQQVACLLYDDRYSGFKAGSEITSADFAERYTTLTKDSSGQMLDDVSRVPLPVATSPILEAVHLQKYFPMRQIRLFRPAQVVHAVEDTSLMLHPGRALALVGESGSGKTTMARLLARLYEPTAGDIVFRGGIVDDGRKGSQAASDALNIPLRAYRRHVQLVFQDPFSSLNAVHTVRYHLARPLRLYGHAHSKAEETRQVLALLNRVSLSPAEQFIQKFPHQLSGGQRQRVAIARALAVQPQVLLADEPVSMLDVSIRLDILNLLLRLKHEEQLALLFITHDIASARYFAEDTLVMYAGQAVEGGPSEEIIQHPRHPYTQLLLSAAPDPDHVVTEHKATFSARGEIPSLITPPSGCRFHLRCPAAMPVCRQRFPGRTQVDNSHWTHCFLYGDGEKA